MRKVYIYVSLLTLAPAQVETLLQTQDPNDVAQNPATTAEPSFNVHIPAVSADPAFNPFVNTMETELPIRTDAFDPMGANQPEFSDHNISANTIPSNESPWEMLSLGLEEPLPPREIVDDLYVQRSDIHILFCASVLT